MARCGQESRRANARPLRSRPTTSGVSSRTAFSSRPTLTFSAGSARYQKPVSIKPLGAWRSRSSPLGIDNRQPNTSTVEGERRPRLASGCHRRSLRLRRARPAGRGLQRTACTLSGGQRDHSFPTRRARSHQADRANREVPLEGNHPAPKAEELGQDHTSHSGALKSRRPGGSIEEGGSENSSLSVA
jgi:hypothetical protein